MAHFQLRVLRRDPERRGIETDSCWIESETPEQAISKAESVLASECTELPGVAMLSDAVGALVWSKRKDMPRPEDFSRS